MNQGNETQKQNSLKKFKQWVKDNPKYCSDFTYHFETFINATKGLKVTCLKHREDFNQGFTRIKEGRGCKQCYHSKLSKAQSSNNSFDKIELHKQFPNLDFTNTIYIDAYSPLEIYCNIHQFYFHKDYDHLSRGQGCPKCNKIGRSKPEKELVSFLVNYTQVIENYRPKWLKGKELDIFLPKFNLAIEFNGLYWHSEDFVKRGYHKAKTDKCSEQGIRLFHIWEDEFLYKESIIQSMLLNILGLTPFKIGARKCVIKDIPLKEANEFLRLNHLLSGNRGVKVKGLYYENELLSVMSLRKEGDFYNLTKFSSKTFTNVQGGFSKLLKSFNIKGVIKSFAERRWSVGGVYLSNGFQESHQTAPNYTYILDGVRFNKKSFTKDKLYKRYGIKVENERDYMYKKGYRRLYDSGLICYTKVVY